MESHWVCGVLAVVVLGGCEAAGTGKQLGERRRAAEWGGSGAGYRRVCVLVTWGYGCFVCVRVLVV